MIVLMIAGCYFPQLLVLITPDFVTTTSHQLQGSHLKEMAWVKRGTPQAAPFWNETQRGNHPHRSLTELSGLRKSQVKLGTLKQYQRCFSDASLDMKLSWNLPAHQIKASNVCISMSRRLAFSETIAIWARLKRIAKLGLAINRQQ